MSDETRDERDLEPEKGGDAAAASAAPGERDVEPTPAERAKAPTARQWVVMRGASMDLRVGSGNLSEFPHVLRSAAGKPHLCVLVHEDGAPEGVVKTLHDNLCAEGFEVAVARLDVPGCDLDAVAAFAGLLDGARATRDDIVLAVGGYETLSVASFACDAWCGGIQLAEVPLDLPAAVLSSTSPRALDAAGRPRMLEQAATARYTCIDLDVVGIDPTSDGAHLAFALMVQTALCESDRAFGRLWDGAEAIAAGDSGALTAQLADTLKSRGKVSSSTSAALRQSLELGATFAAALESVAPGQVSAGVALADGMRFAARLGVVQESLSIDDMLAIDEVLERLGVPTARVSVDPAALVSAIRSERYSRTRRFMLAVPRALGRTRLAVMTEELLSEHVGAWCASRPTE